MTQHSDDERSMGVFSAARGRHMFDRVEPFAQWRQSHTEHGRWGYHQRMLTAPSVRRPRVRDEYGRERSGISLISQDYLALSAHPAVHNAIRTALDTYGPHAGGSPVAAGETALSEELCEQLSRLLGMKHVVLFPTGWSAGFGAVNALARRADHIVVDELSHACLHEGMAASRSPNVTLVPHLDNDAAHSALRRIRADDATHGILVITEGLFSMNSDTPDLAELQRICHDHDAVLLVDQAHDVGVLGPDGLGQAAAQGMFGQLDLVAGSFSKAFATNGGYLATNSDAVAQYIRYFGGTHVFSSALTPLQAAGALTAARIMMSDEGQRRRDTLLRNAEVLREALSGIDRCVVLGDPSPIVPLRLESLAVGRTALAIAEANGVLLHLVEFPIVPRRQARYRLQLSSAHQADDLVHAAAVMAEAITAAWHISDNKKVVTT